MRTGPCAAAAASRASDAPVSCAARVWSPTAAVHRADPWSAPSTGGDSGIPVLAIGVERFSRGVGVGRLLMRALIEVATTLGVPAVNLTTGTFNEAAVHLYQS